MVESYEREISARLNVSNPGLCLDHCESDVDDVGLQHNVVTLILLRKQIIRIHEIVVRCQQLISGELSTQSQVLTGHRQARPAQDIPTGHGYPNYAHAHAPNTNIKLKLGKYYYLYRASQLGMGISIHMSLFMPSHKYISIPKSGIPVMPQHLLQHKI